MSELITRLRKRLERRNLRSQEVTVAIERFDKLKQKARHDDLTGLLNRSAFEETVNKELIFLFRENFPFSVAIIDIDFFKSINDTYGHGIGDEVLKDTAHLLEKSFREGDVVGRYGGEEFAVFLPGADLDGAEIAAERSRSVIEAVTANLYQNVNRGGITVSIGVTQYQSGDNLNSMISRADFAMYQSKQTGRNKVTAITGQ